MAASYRSYVATSRLSWPLAIGCGADGVCVAGATTAQQLALASRQGANSRPLQCDQEPELHPQLTQACFFLPATQVRAVCAETLFGPTPRPLSAQRRVPQRRPRTMRALPNMSGCTRTSVKPCWWSKFAVSDPSASLISRYSTPPGASNSWPNPPRRR